MADARRYPEPREVCGAYACPQVRRLHFLPLQQREIRRGARPGKDCLQGLCRGGQCPAGGSTCQCGNTGSVPARRPVREAAAALKELRPQVLGHEAQMELGRLRHGHELLGRRAGPVAEQGDLNLVGPEAVLLHHKALDTWVASEVLSVLWVIRYCSSADGQE
uniref:Uncharacterized protein n=1 Tax=Tetraselmis sp. GSL018 TaxID=582737 RepID=A0A061SCD7_9CHLO